MINALPQSHSLRRWIAPVLLVGIMLLGYGLGLHRYLTLQSLAENREVLRTFTTQHFFLSLVAFSLAYATAVALSFPGGLLLTLTGGLLFGGLTGGMASVLAATTGATAVFQIAKSSFGEVLARKAGPALTRLREGFAADAFNYLLFLRLVPAFPFWLVNIAPALANVRLRVFVAATFLGIIPATFAFSFVGAGLDSIIASQAAAYQACVSEKGADNCAYDLSLSSLITWQLLVAFIALGVVALIPVAARIMTKGKQRKDEI